MSGETGVGVHFAFHSDLFVEYIFIKDMGGVEQKQYKFVVKKVKRKEPAFARLPY